MNIYTPPSIPVPIQIPGCRLAVDTLDYNDFNLSGTDILNWYDKAGRSTGFINSDGVVDYSAAQLNGRAAAVYDGGSNLFIGLTLAQPVTYFLVHQFDGVTTDTICDGANSSNRILLRTLDIGGGPIWVAATNTGTGMYSSQVIDTDPHYIRVEYNGASSKMFVDGIQRASGDTGTTGITGLTLGSEYDLTDGFSGKVYGFYVYDGILSAANASLLDTFASRTWGI